MTNQLVLIQNPFLDDFIVSNGLIRRLAEQFEAVHLLVPDTSAELIGWMFRDNSRINPVGITSVPAQDDFQWGKGPTVDTFVNSARRWVRSQVPANVLQIGIEKITEFNQPAKQLYKSGGVDLSCRNTLYKVERDLASEKALFDSLGLEKGKYVFIHEEPKSRALVKTAIVNNSLPAVRPEEGKNPFDYQMIIENAAEVHCIRSTFFLIADALNGVLPPLYLHDAPGNYLETLPYEYSAAWKRVA